MASYNFTKYNVVKVNGTDIKTVKFNGSTIWTKPPATRSSFTYSTNRDNLRHGTTTSNSKTFGGLPVTKGSTTIKLAGRVYTQWNSNNSNWSGAYNSYYWCSYKVALYNGSTLLHTTAWSRNYWSMLNNFTHTWSTNTSQHITKAILYISTKTSNQYSHYYCHAYSTATLTIG